MILEGLVTTINEDGRVNFAPMGPVIDGRDFGELRLRPFPTSTTCHNLRRLPTGVFHITDDVELLAASAIDRLEIDPAVRPAPGIEGYILTDACRWYAFEAVEFDDSGPRTSIRCPIVQHGRIRDFLGFNRAKHAVLELAVLATRLHLLPSAEVFRDLEHYRIVVRKTGGPQELRAFELLETFVRESYAVVEQPGCD